MLNSRFYLEIFFQSTKKSFAYSVLQNLYDGLAFIEYAIVHRQEKTRRWRYSYRKIGMWWRYSNSSRIQLFWKWSVCLSRTPTVTSDFNHPSKDYLNYLFTDLSTEMMSTQNDGQNSGRYNHWFRSWIKLEILLQYQYNFLLLILQKR